MFEARIRQRRFMRRFGPGVPMHKLFIYLVSLGHFAVDLAPGALPAILPFLVLHNGISYTQVAGLMFASSCLASVLQPVFGYWADKSSRHWFIGAGIAMSGLGLGLTGLFTNYWAIFAARPLAPGRQTTSLRKRKLSHRAFGRCRAQPPAPRDFHRWRRQLPTALQAQASRR